MTQSKVVKEAGLTEALRLVKGELDKKIEQADLAQVAFTGDYEDLINVPEELTANDVDNIWISLNPTPTSS